MRALIYACTTAADLGRTVLDEKLPELRRYASMRDWELAGEYSDATPTGSGRRPGFDRLCSDIESRKGDIVLANALHDLFWDLTQIGRFAEPWSRAGIRLVCVQNDFDATTELGWREFVFFAARVDEWRRGRMKERQRIGIIRAQLRAAGAPIAGRPRAVVNPMEIKAGYERGLSQREICERIERAGGHVCKGTVGRIVADLRSTGQLDEARREAAIAARGGLRPGGRQPPRGRRMSDQEVIDAWYSGAPLRVIAAKLAADGASVSPSILRAKLADLRSEGQLDESRREDAVAERRRKRAA